MDISPEDGRAIMETAEYRKVGDRIEILYNDKWLHLCRTDLQDDVCTWIIGKDVGFYKRAIRHGVRIKNGNATFAVIDAFSDG